MARKNRSRKNGDQAALDELTRPALAKIRRGSVLVVVAGLLWPFQAALVALALAGLFAPASGGAPGPLLSAAGFIAVGLARASLSHAGEGLLFRGGTGVIAAARTRMVQSEMRIGARPAGGWGAGSVAALAGEKLDMLLPYVTRYGPARLRVMVTPVVILLLTFWFSWAAGLVLLVSGPLIPVFMALIGWTAKDASERQLREMGTLNDLLIERLSALIDIRLLNASGDVNAQFARSAEQLRVRTMNVLRIAFLSSTVLELFAAIGVAMMAVYVGFSLLGAIEFGAYGAPLAPAAGLFLLLLAPDYYQPLRDLSAAWHDRAAALAVAGEFSAWENAAAQRLMGEGATMPALEGSATIEFANVAARGGKRLISYPNIIIRPGETVAVTGASGVGKTTFLRLIAGLIEAERGEVRVAGQKLDDTTADRWRARLGWMPQAPHFLDETLDYNIGFGAPGDLDRAFETAAIGDVIATLPDGPSTRLGETGGGLSGGEARRVTLARAVFRSPGVLLADEPTADLDAETAQSVMRGLFDLAERGTTLIVATHDPDIGARMGRVIVLDGDGDAGS